MTRPATAAEDAAYLLGLADRVNAAGGQRAAAAVVTDLDAATLRRIAAHLQRIASGGDRPAPSDPSNAGGR